MTIQEKSETAVSETEEILTDCRNCGNPLDEMSIKAALDICDKCRTVMADYGYYDDWDDYEEREYDRVYTCSICGGETGDGWSTCTCWRDNLGTEWIGDDEPYPDEEE